MIGSNQIVATRLILEELQAMIVCQSFEKILVNECCFRPRPRLEK